VLRCAGHWTKISASSAITVSPRRRRLALYARFLPDQNIGSAETAAFLCQLARHLRGRVMVLWDGGNQHKGVPVRRFQQRHSAWEFLRFPGYAPDLLLREFVVSHAGFQAALASNCLMLALRVANSAAVSNWPRVVRR
jgi:hypothetical protein